jgi:hypothetical protein
VATLLQPGPGTGALLAVRRCLGAPANLSQDQLAAPAGGLCRCLLLLLEDPSNPALLPTGAQSVWAVAVGEQRQLRRGSALRRAEAVVLMASYLDAVGAALQPLDRLAAALHGLGRTCGAVVAGQLPGPGRVLLQQGSPAESCFPATGKGLPLGTLDASVAAAGGGAGGGRAVIVSADVTKLTCDTPPITADAAAVSALAAAAADVAAAGARVQVGRGPPGAGRPAWARARACPRRSHAPPAPMHTHLPHTYHADVMAPPRSPRMRAAQEAQARVELVISTLGDRFDATDEAVLAAWEELRREAGAAAGDATARAQVRPQGCWQGLSPIPPPPTPRPPPTPAPSPRPPHALDPCATTNPHILPAGFWLVACILLYSFVTSPPTHTYTQLLGIRAPTRPHPQGDLVTSLSLLPFAHQIIPFQSLHAGGRRPAGRYDRAAAAEPRGSRGSLGGPGGLTAGDRSRHRGGQHAHRAGAGGAGPPRAGAVGCGMVVGLSIAHLCMFRLNRRTTLPSRRPTKIFLQSIRGDHLLYTTRRENLRVFWP